jgi:uncharacterized protein YkwD
MKQILFFIFVLFILGCGSYSTKQINKQYLLLLHNKERASRNIQQLLENKELERLAQKHADKMASNSYLIHSKLNLNEFNHMGENIAEGQESEESVIDSWMNSKGHKQNILDKDYTHAGIGYSIVNGDPYWCVIFGG